MIFSFTEGVCVDNDFSSLKNINSKIILIIIQTYSQNLDKGSMIFISSFEWNIVREDPNMDWLKKKESVMAFPVIIIKKWF